MINLTNLLELEINKPPIKIPIRVDNDNQFNEIIQRLKDDNRWSSLSVRGLKKRPYPFYIKQRGSNHMWLITSNNDQKPISHILQQIKSLPKNKQIELRQILKDKFKIQEKLNNNKQPITEEETFYGGGSNYFKCYRTAAIGLGAGMQMYGWGLYFAKDVNMANGYAGVGSNSGKKMILFQGKNPHELAFEYDCIVFERLPSKLQTVDEFIEYAEDMIEILEEDEDPDDIPLIKEYKRFIDIIKGMEIQTEPMRYVYTVLLHKGKKPSEYEYLDLDNRVPQNQINKINNRAKQENHNFQFTTSLSGFDVYNKIENYFKNQGSTNAPKDASLFLLRSGIDGNTHSNGSVRIIFDEKAITIINVCKK